MKTDIILLAFPVITLLGLVVFYATVMSGRAVEADRVRGLRWRIRARLRPGPRYASLSELVFRWGRMPALWHGRRARPGLSLSRRLRSRTTDFAVRFGRAQYGRRCYGRLEDQVGVLAPQRTAKTGLLIDRILDHPGAVITSSSRADIYGASAASRARRGPVEVFNPLGIGGVQSTFSWDLLSACDDEMAAERMADWLAGGTGGHGNIEWFESKGSFALGALLLAANIGGHSITDVYWWIHSGDAMNCPAIAILQKHGNREMAQLIVRLLGTDRTAGSVRDTIDKTLQWAAMPQLAAAASRQGVFDHLSLVERCGTLYLITSGDSRSLITPLIRALASYVHFQAGLIGSKLRHEKLDPPLLMALDEVSVTCPIDLPAMLSDSAGKGILITWIAHSVSQLEERWGQYGAETIIACSGVLLLLGGIKNEQTLERVSKLCGTIESGNGSVRVMPLELLRMLPNWRALVIRMNLFPVVVKFRPYWHRTGYRWPFSLRRVVPVPYPEYTGPKPWLEVPEDIEDLAGVKPAPSANGNGHKPQAWIPEA